MNAAEVNDDILSTIYDGLAQALRGSSVATSPAAAARNTVSDNRLFALLAVCFSL